MYIYIHIENINKTYYMLSPEEEPGLHKTSHSKISQQDWYSFIEMVGAYLG